MVAKPKVGKTVTVRNLAKAVSRGSPFLNRGTLQGTVIYLAMEEIEEMVKQSFRKMGVTDSDPIMIRCSMMDETSARRLHASIRNDPPALLIVDTLFRFARIRDENKYAEVTRALNPLINLARETGTHILATHHAKKEIAIGDPMDAVLGSTAIFGSVDTAIMLQKNSQGIRTIWSGQRYGTAIPKTILRLNTERERTWIVSETVHVEPAGEMRQERKELLNIVINSKDPLSAKQVAQRANKNESTTRNMLEKLILAGDIEKCKEEGHVTYAPRTS